VQDGVANSAILKASCNFVGINYGKMTDDRQGGEFITVVPKSGRNPQQGKPWGGTEGRKRQGKAGIKTFLCF
jgi:hypothetical protein